MHQIKTVEMPILRHNPSYQKVSSLLLDEEGEEKIEIEWWTEKVEEEQEQEKKTVQWKREKKMLKQNEKAKEKRKKADNRTRKRKEGEEKEKANDQGAQSGEFRG